VLEEMGRRLLCAPFFSTVVLAATTLLESGDDTAKAEWLPGIADGSTIATLAVTEDTGKWTADSVEATATPSGDGFTLSGVKSYVLDGHIADLVLVVARTDAGPSLFAVRGDAAGLVRTPMMTLDETRKQARLELDGTPGVLVGTDGGAAEVLERAYDQIVTGLAAEQMGGAQFCLEQATEYAAVRVQYGRIIGSYQAIKHKLANVLMVVELGKTAAYQAAKCAAETPDELPEAAAMAKSFCSDAYLKAAADNIQVHGGMGFTWEHHSHLYLRRAKSSELLFGEPSEWRARLADTVGIS
jgi:alkylation response protein AidB-like acyl-CoA dehydrogenase